jgi:hypothetical protein
MGLTREPPQVLAFIQLRKPCAGGVDLPCSGQWPGPENQQQGYALIRLQPQQRV